MATIDAVLSAGSRNTVTPVRAAPARPTFRKTVSRPSAKTESENGMKSSEDGSPGRTSRQSLTRSSTVSRLSQASDATRGALSITKAVLKRQARKASHGLCVRVSVMLNNFVMQAIESSPVCLPARPRSP